jgi:transposase
MSPHRGDVDERQWARLRPLLPPQRPHVGRPANDHRTVLNGILWVLRTGSPLRGKEKDVAKGTK